MSDNEPITPKETIDIEVGAGGASAYTLDRFMEATNSEVEDLPNPAADEDEGEEFVRDEDLEDELEEEDSPDLDEDEEGEDEDEEGEDEDDEDEDEGSDEELDDDDEDDEEELDGEEDTEGDRKYLRGKTADGEDFNIPEDLVILQKVDGEVQEIPLREHMNMVAGELTVNQRLGKLSSLKESLEAQNRQAHEMVQQRLEFDAQMAKLADEGKVEDAIFMLAEKLGTNPIPMIRKFHATFARQLKQWQGKTKADVENSYLRKEAEWERRRTQQRQAADTQNTQVSSFMQETLAMLEEKGISQEEFDAVYSGLKERGELGRFNNGAEARAFVIQSTHQAKVGLKVVTVIEKVDPKLMKDEALVRRLEKAAVFRDYSEDELEELLRDHLGQSKKRRASNLSRKARKNKSAATSKKKSDAKPVELEGKTFKGIADLDKMFGFSS